MREPQALAVHWCLMDVWVMLASLSYFSIFFSDRLLLRRLARRGFPRDTTFLFSPKPTREIPTMLGSISSWSALFLVVVILLVTNSSAQVQWFLSNGQIAEFGGRVTVGGNFNPFICGQYINGSTMVAHLLTSYDPPLVQYQYSLGDYALNQLNDLATWPLPGIGCAIWTDPGQTWLVVSGISTTDQQATCNESVSFVTLGMDMGSANGITSKSTELSQAPRDGAVGFAEYYDSIVRVAFTSGVLDPPSDSPCSPITNTNPPRKKRQNQGNYIFNIDTLDFNSPPVSTQTPFFPADHPVQGLGYGSLVIQDFNNDYNADIFMCGTVYNSSSGLDQPYSRIWYADFTNVTNSTYPLQFVPGPQVFPQLTHCSAAAFIFESFYGDYTPIQSLFLTGTDGSGNRICQVWQLLGTGWTLNTDALVNVECVSHGAVLMEDLNGDGCTDLVLQGDPSSASGATMEGSPTVGSTTVYSGDCTVFRFQQRLRPMHSGGVSAYIPKGFKRSKQGKRALINGNTWNVIVSGVEELSGGERSYGTYAYTWSDYMSTTTTAAEAASTTAVQAAVSASTTQSASLASLAAAGLLDSTTAAAASSNAAAATSLTSAQVTLSQSTVSLATSTSSFAVTTSTQSTLTLATSTTSTRSTLVTSATSAQATSIDSVVTSLASAAATALATSTGETVIPISNDANQPRSIIIPPVSAAPNQEDGAMKVSPLLGDINGDLPFIEYQIRVKNFVELDGYGLPITSCPVPTGEFTLNTETSTSPGGYPITVNFFTATLCNGATILAKYTQYSAAEIITFADLELSVSPASVKLVYVISDWPFDAEDSSLEVELELVLSQAPIASYIIPRDENHLLWNMQMAEKLWISSVLIRKAEVDGVPTMVDIYPTSSSFLGVKVRVPYFTYGVSIDPSFDVLLEGNSKKKKSKAPAIAGGVAGGLAVLVVAGVIIGYLIFKKKGVASFGSSSAGAGGSGGTA